MSLEKKHFSLQGQDVYVGELVLDQQIELRRLFRDVDIEMSADHTPLDILDQIIDKELLKPFLGIIFQGSENIDIGQLTAAELESIFSFFLSLNLASVSKLLSFLKSFVALTILATTKSTTSSES